MAKRFTETNKWDDEWFLGLTPIQKLVFQFLTDRCDNAGFMEVNPRFNSFRIGISESEYLGAIEGLIRGLIRSRDGKRIWIRKFLFHQKNLPLNLKNNAHKQIVSILQKTSTEFDYDFKDLGAIEGLISPIGIGIGIDKGNGKEGGVGETEATGSPIFLLEGNPIHLNPSVWMQKNKGIFLDQCRMKFPFDQKEWYQVYQDFDTKAIGEGKYATEAHLSNAFRKSCEQFQKDKEYGKNQPKNSGHHRFQSIGTGAAKDFTDGHKLGT